MPNFDESAHEPTPNLLAQKVADLEGRLTRRPMTAERRDVAKAVERLSTGMLRLLGDLASHGLAEEGDNQALQNVVALELAHRIQLADLDLPLYKGHDEAIATPLDQLFDELDQAIEAGMKAKMMTAEEREKRYEDFIRAKGWLEEGESLGRGAGPAAILVSSPAAPWAEWTDHEQYVLGTVSTPLDEPDHPYGQWSGRLRWLVAGGEDVGLELQFLVGDFQFEPGTKLGFFLGSRHVTDLVVLPCGLPGMPPDSSST